MSTRVVPGAFGCDAIQFVCDRKFTNVRLPGSETEQFERYADELTSSSRLPMLDGVPVAAWVLARLAALSGDRFPFSYGQICGSDGDDFWIMSLAFADDGTVRPVGSVSLLGGRDYVKLWIHAVAPFSPARVKNAFTDALLSDSTALRRAVVTVVYTSVEDPKHALHVPYTIGWDGHGFVFRDAPEHTIYPEDEEEKAAQPGATDNLGYAQRIREGSSFRSSEARCLSFIVGQGRQSVRFT